MSYSPEKDPNYDLIKLAEASRQPFDPEVTLFVSNSGTSEEARVILDNQVEPYRPIPSNDPRAPVAVFGFSAYEGISGANELAAELKAFDEDVQTAYEEHIGVNQPK